MPSKLTLLERTYKRWVPPYWEFPTTEPTEEGVLTQSWTDDLLLSSNHGMRTIMDLSATTHGDVGDPFLVHKRRYEERILNDGADTHFSWSTDPEQTASPYYLTNQWPYRDQFNNGHFDMPTASTDDELAALGTTAIARVAPTKPQADLGTFLGELHEGLPSAVGLSMTGKARAAQARNAGDEYLNVEFGWKPLERDVKSFARSVLEAERLLQEYHANSGKLLKRRYRFPTELEVEEKSLGYTYPTPLLHPWCYMGGPRELKVVTTKKVERWFSGTFTYFVPDVGSPHRALSDANHLFGTKLTPDTLWNLAPWSWAADWASNMGDVTSNLASFSTDGLVMHHGYMMEKKTIRKDYTMDCTDFWLSHRGPHSLRQTFIGETKKRIRATPYGFGLSWDGFTDRQLGIIAALGATKAHK